MIDINIVGRCPQKTKMERFAQDVIHSFFTSRFSRDVHIDINVCRVEEGYLGFCSGDRDSVEIEVSRRDILGEMLSPKDIAHIIAHELVHAKQFIKGQIDGTERYRRGPHSKWVDHSETSYREQPWEVEAYDLEDKLLETYWVSDTTSRSS